MSNQRTLPLPEKTASFSVGLSKKRELFAKMALFWSKELTEELMQAWEEILKNCSVAECEYACEHWLRNGHYWPKPADLLELVSVYRDGNRYLRGERYEHHGTGYGETEVQLLWKLFSRRRERLQGPLGNEDTKILLDELDQMTGRK
jgi:hypothetical protein